MLLLAVACDDSVGDDEAAAIVARAKAQYPTILEVHRGVVSRSCAPNAGVCHDTSNYPELSTPAAFLRTVGEWCNLAIPDPSQGFDLCERHGDVFVSGSFRSEIAFLDQTSPKEWRVTLRDPSPRTSPVAVVRFDSPQGDVVFSPLSVWGMTAELSEGSREIVISLGVDDPFFTEPLVQSGMAALVQGDANRNGEFGANGNADVRDVARVLTPGSLERSYLWGRITGTVPGTRMPLANQALTEEEYVAVACMIESLPNDGTQPRPDLPIDYDACAYAKAPERHAIPN